MNHHPSRRSFLTASALCPLAASAALGAKTETSSNPADAFRLCLNASTIKGANLGIESQIQIAAQAGYDGIEPWLRDIEAYAAAGGSLDDLAKLIEDSGLAVESAIGFARWAADDRVERIQGLEQLKRDMDTIHRIGGRRIACPPAGISKADPIPLASIADRYRAVLEIGARREVLPLLEVWGHSTNLSKLPQVLFAAAESRHPDAALLLDIYHLHRGGSGFDGLSLLSAKALPVIHLNDYPGGILHSELRDQDRVMPGDGAAPFASIMPLLRAINPNMTLSLELFNRDVWQMPPLEAAQLGIEKMRAVTQLYSTSSQF